MSKLERLFLRLQRSVVDTTTYKGLAAEVAFDLATFDTFVAGTARALLSGRAPTIQDGSVLQRSLPLKGSLWTTESGQQVDLTDFPELLAHATLLESVRKECARSRGRV